jgi:hypothetical protein
MQLLRFPATLALFDDAGAERRQLKSTFLEPTRVTAPWSTAMPAAYSL